MLAAGSSGPGVPCGFNWVCLLAFHSRMGFVAPELERGEHPMWKVDRGAMVPEKNKRSLPAGRLTIVFETKAMRC